MTNVRILTHKSSTFRSKPLLFIEMAVFRHQKIHFPAIYDQQFKKRARTSAKKLMFEMESEKNIYKDKNKKALGF